MKNIKHLLLTLLILACASSSAWARMGVLALGGGAPSSCAETGCSGCTYEERFECGTNDGNEENAWTITGSVGVDFDGASSPLAGTESLSFTRSTAGDSIVYLPVTGSDGDNYISFRVNATALFGNEGIFYVKNSIGTTIVSLSLYYVSSSYKIRINHNGGSSNLTGTTETAVGDTIYVKLLYNPGTGLNGKVQSFISTDGSTWSLQTNVTNSNDQDVPSRLTFVQSSTNIKYKVDSIRMRTDGTDVGNY